MNSYLSLDEAYAAYVAHTLQREQSRDAWLERKRAAEREALEQVDDAIAHRLASKPVVGPPQRQTRPLVFD